MILGIIIFQGVIFLALIFILRQFMKGHVSGAIGHLQQINDELIKQQTETKQKIAAAEQEYQSKLSRVQEEVQSKQTEAKSEATKMLEDARQRALQEREKIINEAVETRDKMRNEVMGEMEAKAVEYSKRVLAEFLSDDIRVKVHECLVKQVVTGLKDVDMSTFEIPDATAELLSAEIIPDSFKAEIGRILSEKIKKEVSFKEELNPDLVGGLILRFGPLVIDGSLSNLMDEAASRLRKEAVRKYQGNS